MHNDVIISASRDQPGAHVTTFRLLQCRAAGLHFAGLPADLSTLGPPGRE